MIELEKKNILDNVETVFTVEFDTERDAEIIYNSIKPEISFSRNDRSKTIMHLDNNSIIITIKSKDVVSLRASINSYVRWINLSTKILKI
ncbi:KEOPS complex subunit Pcc1 [uncultured Methanosphaera sp.]|uniref:KEOPS complex subunit Pcc1 n=1 Tax=uncultured Methanosphaera sp. TaxID=262501 RepID=UPI0025D20A86|nr:KEOPS complex subunit Pcc1 [uncultured Methanosphaera sp.]